MQVAIEDASPRCLAELCEIETQCFGREAFSKQQIAYLLADYNSVGFVARIHERIVGFVIATVCVRSAETVGHILTIDVLPNYRRKGVAQRLLQEIERVFIEMGVRASHLEVREGNTPALGLYSKLGYVKVEKLVHYYGNAHGIRLRKMLAQSPQS